MHLNIEIVFEHSRCFDCGGYWAVEKFRQTRNLICPYCAGVKVAAAGERLMARERSMRALKANFTRIKNKRPKGNSRIEQP